IEPRQILQPNKTVEPSQPASTNHLCKVQEERGYLRLMFLRRMLLRVHAVRVGHLTHVKIRDLVIGQGHRPRFLKFRPMQGAADVPADAPVPAVSSGIVEPALCRKPFHCRHGAFPWTANASAISGTRSVQSRALRLNTRTRSPSRRAMNRNPSCLTSNAPREPSGTACASVGRQGSMKPAGWAGELASTARA